MLADMTTVLEFKFAFCLIKSLQLKLFQIRLGLRYSGHSSEVYLVLGDGVILYL